jgi:DNA polymerase I
MNTLVNTGFYLEDDISEKVKTLTWLKGRTLRCCETIEELRNFIDLAIPAGICALDLETTGLNSRTRNGKPIEKIVGFCLSYDSKFGLYVPINHVVNPEDNLSKELVLEEIKRLVRNTVTIYHNAKFDLAFLRNYGIILDDFTKFEDTLILAKLFDAGQKDIKLKHLSERLLSQPMLEFKEVAKEGQFAMIPARTIGYIYGGCDGICTLDLYNFFRKHDIVKNQNTIYKVEKRCVFAVMQMESNLVMVDVPYLAELQKTTSKRIESIKREIYALIGREFNLGSTQQLGKILFEELKYTYPTKEKTAKGQWKTDTAVLEKLAETQPIVKKIVEFRELEKSLGTYINNLLLNHDENNCIKLGFNQNGTDTGRFSSPGGEGIDHDGYCGVNVQALPSNYSDTAPDIRKAFIARPGFKIVACDYSGEELRVATNLSREPQWVEEFLYGKADIHTKTAQIIFGRQEITKAERQLGKTINFLIMYGGGSRGLAQQAKISENEAARIIKAYFKGLPTLDSWLKSVIKRARKEKFIRTAFGRMRPLAMFYDSGDRASESHADRCATNTAIQGASADIMKTTMVRLHSWIMSNNLQDTIRMLITMHDEIVFEIREDKLEEYIPQINDIMGLKDVLAKLQWQVPLVIDAEYGDSWHVDHDFFKEHPELKDSCKPVEFVQQEQVTGRYAIALGKETTTEDIVGEIKKEKEDDKKDPPAPPVESAPVQEAVEENNSPVSEEVSQMISPEESSIPENDKIPENNSQNSESTENSLIYNIRDRRRSTVRLLNMIISFIKEESGLRNPYHGPKKSLIIKDFDGNSMLVEDMRIDPVAFLSLARFLGV